MKALAIDDAESVLGEIPISLKRGIGFEKLKLYITRKRIIVAHGSKKGPRALALRPLLGRYSGDLEESSKGRDEQVVRNNLQSLRPGIILSSNKDNFALGYEELVSVEMRESSGTTSITILTREDKFQFSSDTGLREVAELLSPHLGAKLVI